MAVKTNATKCFRYMCKSGASPSNRVVWYIAKSDNVEIMKLAYDRVPEIVARKQTCKTATKYGRIKIVRYLYDIKCPRPANICDTAAAHGNAACLAYLDKTGSKCTSTTFAYSALNLGCMKYLVSIKCPRQL